MKTSLHTTIFMRSRNQGFTLVEVMVGLALSLLSMLIIIQLFSVSDARKRVTTGAAEAQQTANVSLYQVSRVIRLGGAGLTQGNNVWGCPIQASRSGTTILPASTAYPGAFVNVYSSYPVLRAIPVLILPGAAPGGSDVVVVISANGENGQAALQLIAPPAPLRLTMQLLNGIRSRDLILMTNPAAIGNCSIAQVDTTFNPATAPNTIPLGATGTLYNPTAGLPTTFNQGSVALQLGAAPSFAMFGINNTTNSLEQYDLLSAPGTTPTVIADSVFDMRARYGVLDASGAGPIAWQSPTDAGWQTSDMLAGTPAALNLIDRIRAIRISIVFRSTEPVTDVSPPTNYIMFPDDNPITVTIPTADQRYRYQIYDTVIPLRNLRYVTNPVAPFLPYTRPS